MEGSQPAERLRQSLEERLARDGLEDREAGGLPPRPPKQAYGSPRSLPSSQQDVRLQGSPLKTLAVAADACSPEGHAGPQGVAAEQRLGGSQHGSGAAAAAIWMLAREAAARAAMAAAQEQEAMASLELAGLSHAAAGAACAGGSSLVRTTSLPSSNMASPRFTSSMEYLGAGLGSRGTMRKSASATHLDLWVQHATHARISEEQSIPVSRDGAPDSSGPPPPEHLLPQYVSERQRQLAAVNQTLVAVGSASGAVTAAAAPGVGLGTGTTRPDTDPLPDSLGAVSSVAPIDSPTGTHNTYRASPGSNPKLPQSSTTSYSGHPPRQSFLSDGTLMVGPTHPSNTAAGLKPSPLGAPPKQSGGKPDLHSQSTLAVAASMLLGTTPSGRSDHTHTGGAAPAGGGRPRSALARLLHALVPACFRPSETEEHALPSLPAPTMPVAAAGQGAAGGQAGGRVSMQGSTINMAAAAALGSMHRRMNAQRAAAAAAGGMSSSSLHGGTNANEPSLHGGGLPASQQPSFLQAGPHPGAVLGGGALASSSDMAGLVPWFDEMSWTNLMAASGNSQSPLGPLGGGAGGGHGHAGGVGQGAGAGGAGEPGGCASRTTSITAASVRAASMSAAGRQATHAAAVTAGGGAAAWIAARRTTSSLGQQGGVVGLGAFSGAPLRVAAARHSMSSSLRRTTSGASVTPGMLTHAASTRSQAAYPTGPGSSGREGAGAGPGAPPSPLPAAALHAGGSSSFNNAGTAHHHGLSPRAVQLLQLQGEGPQPHGTAAGGGAGHVPMHSRSQSRTGWSVTHGAMSGSEPLHTLNAGAGQEPGSTSMLRSRASMTAAGGGGPALGGVHGGGGGGALSQGLRQANSSRSLSQQVSGALSPAMGQGQGTFPVSPLLHANSSFLRRSVDCPPGAIVGSGAVHGGGGPPLLLHSGSGRASPMPSGEQPQAPGAPPAVSRRVSVDHMQLPASRSVSNVMLQHLGSGRGCSITGAGTGVPALWDGPSYGYFGGDAESMAGLDGDAAIAAAAAGAGAGGGGWLATGGIGAAWQAMRSPGGALRGGREAGSYPGGPQRIHKVLYLHPDMACAGSSSTMPGAMAAYGASATAQAPLPPPAMQPMPHASGASGPLIFAGSPQPCLGEQQQANVQAQAQAAQMAGSPGLGSASPLGLASWGPCLSDFETLHVVNEGYAANVHQAYCGITRQITILKTYRLSRLDAMGRRHMHREISILASASGHPHIVRLWAAFQEDEHVVLVLEYADAGDLHGILRKHHGRLSEQHAVCKVLVPLLQALQALHAAGIVHRDIKPANVCFNSRGEMRLCDFGLAINTRRERAQSRIGTRGYIAPELLLAPPQPRTSRKGGANDGGHGGISTDRSSPTLTSGGGALQWALSVSSAVKQRLRLSLTGSTPKQQGQGQGQGAGPSTLPSQEEPQGQALLAIEKAVAETAAAEAATAAPGGPGASAVAPAAAAEVMAGAAGARAAAGAELTGAPRPVSAASSAAGEPNAPPHGRPGAGVAGPPAPAHSATRGMAGAASGAATVAAGAAPAAPSSGFSPALDIWSVGIMTYQMLCGAKPFPSDAELVKVLREGKPLPALVFPEHVPPEARDFISCCLVQQPELRHTAAHLLAHPWILAQQAIARQKQQQAQAQAQGQHGQGRQEKQPGQAAA